MYPFDALISKLDKCELNYGMTVQWIYGGRGLKIIYKENQQYDIVGKKAIAIVNCKDR